MTSHLPSRQPGSVVKTRAGRPGRIRRPLKEIPMTSEPIRDPVTDHLLTPQNSALIVIDYQPSQVQMVQSMDHDLLVRNIASRLLKGV